MKTNRISRCVFVVAMVTLCLCGCRQEPAPEVVAPRPQFAGPDYWPLTAGATYTYDCTFNDLNEQQTMVVQRQIIDGAEIFYVVDQTKLSEPDPIIGTDLPGLGAYGWSTAGVVTGESFWKHELATVKPAAMQTMLQLPLQAGDVTEVVDGERTSTFTVAGFESVTVPAGTFDTCARIDVVRVWQNGNQYTGSFWLAPAVGLVKWQMGTGRVEALAAYTIPEAAGK